MAFFNIKERKIEPAPIPPIPPYVPPVPPAPIVPEEGSTPDIDRPSYTSDTNLVLYMVYDDKNTMFKTLNTQYVLTGAFKEDVNMLRPVITLESEIDLTQFNYIYISEFDRYYFMKVNLLTGHLYECVCDVDPLYSLRNELIIIPCIIDREEQHNGLYIDDGSFVAGTKDYTQIYNFSNGFNEQGKNILICCGGN